ncbi:MAG TPA: S53 family peptidase [Ktedonobacteraceae bacterium]|nr:S53 family peptidase [Ktedonobacteraceae bacterium]
MQTMRRIIPFFVICLLLAACAPLGNGNAGTPTPKATATKTTTTAGATPIDPLTPTVDNSPLVCPTELTSYANCQTPRSMRLAYGVESLMQHGFTGEGQTVVDIVSFGSPYLQEDMDIFDRQFNLPPITIKVLSPIGTVPFNPANKDMNGWAGETELDVQIIHAIAPGANIVVLTSPVSETEGTIGLPQFLQLEQYALTNHLGTIISQSWGASEVTLKDSAGQQEIQKWDAFYKQATTQQGITFFGSSGDNGSTDFTDLKATILSTRPTTSFPTDDPWVTSVGGTSLGRTGTTSFQETAWNHSGGGFSSFYATPSFQHSLPASVQQELSNRRGVPDVSGDADPNTGLAIYLGSWQLGGGTSASAPLWAAITAIANQMAGHALGFLNPALYKLAASSSYAQDFHDVNQGNNSQNVGGTIVQGYSAAQGWDPVTGLGSPNAEKLIPDLIAAMKA